MKIGIAGFGFVGQALRSAMVESPVIYDPFKSSLDGTIEDLSVCDVVFCCLPTPKMKDGEQNLSAYSAFLDSLTDAVENNPLKSKIRPAQTPILVIKSTAVYRKLKEIVDGRFNIVLNPEFLNQNSSVEDFQNQNVIILGGRVDHCIEVQKAYKQFFCFETNPKFEHCTAEEASQVKYIHNIYHAYKVLFWNFVHETTGNTRKIFKMYSMITGKTNEMERICADGKPGFGGACFPKDVAAWNAEHEHDLTDFMLEYNKKIREE